MQQACVEVVESPQPARGAVEEDAVRNLQIAISMTPTAWAVSGDLSLLEWSQSGRRLGIIGWAIGEAVAIFGAVYYYMLGVPTWYVMGLAFMLGVFALFPVRRD